MGKRRDIVVGDWVEWASEITDKKLAGQVVAMLSEGEGTTDEWVGKVIFLDGATYRVLVCPPGERRKEYSMRGDQLTRIKAPKFPSWYKYHLPIPTREPDGEWSCQQRWINHATRDIGGANALCVDAAGRVCCNGGDFQRAEDEGTYPIRYYYGAGGENKAEQRKSQAAARRADKLNHPLRYR